MPIYRLDAIPGLDEFGHDRLTRQITDDPKQLALWFGTQTSSLQPLTSRADIGDIGESDQRHRVAGSQLLDCSGEDDLALVHHHDVAARVFHFRQRSEER